MTSATTTAGAPSARRLSRRWLAGGCAIIVLLITGLFWLFTRSPFADEVRRMGGRYGSMMPYDSMEAVRQLLIRNPLPKFHRVQLSGTQVDDNWLHAHRAAIESVPLLDLRLRDTAVTDEGLAALRNLKNVQSLDLSGTTVTGASVVHINSLPHLCSVNIADTRITDADLSQFTPGVMRLGIDSRQASPDGIGVLTKCPNLRELYVYEATDECVTRLTQLSQVDTVRLQGESLTLNGLLALQTMRQLHTVVLIDTQLSDEELRQLRAAVPRCLGQWDQKTIDEMEDSRW